MEIESNLELIKKPVYVALIIMLYSCYFLLYVGIFYINPTYIKSLSIAIRLFICMFLLYKFHPFREHKLSYFDDKLIFASAILILTDMGITQYVVNIIAPTKNIKVF